MKYPHIVVKNGVWYPAGAEVPEDAPLKVLKVELTDNVPEGALEDNPDGSVNAYNENGEVVDTISVEEVAKLQKEAGETFEEPEKGKRGRKAKEEKE
ncbi:MAG: hypothetical protein K6G30_06735 [Acetatifactor sp.]|nr:hypothetical protein [Acetatifactor sp.]